MMNNWLGFDSPLMNILNKLLNLLILNICFLLCCIPIVTAGAGLTALYAVNLKMVRDEEPSVWSGFWKEFRRNFRQSTICYGILLAIGVLLFWNFRIFMRLSGIPAVILGVLIILIFVLYLMEFFYVFPYIARFEDRLEVCMVNAVLIGFEKIGYTLTFLLITAAVLFFLLSDAELLLQSLIIWLLLGFSLMNYIFSKLLRSMFDKYS